MPFVLIVIGAVLIVTALNGTSGKLGKQLGSDLFGSGSGNGFIYWVAAIVIMGFVGYIPKMQKFADAMIVLILVAMILNRNGFFSEFSQALQSTSSTAATSAASQPATAGGIAAGGTSALSGLLPSIFSASGTGSGSTSYSDIPITGTGTMINPFEGVPTSTTTPSYTTIDASNSTQLYDDPLSGLLTGSDTAGSGGQGNSETPGTIVLPQFDITE